MRRRRHGVRSRRRGHCPSVGSSIRWLELRALFFRRCRSVTRSIDREDHVQTARIMGNRHHHKKQRARVRAIMAETGESYQRALVRVLREQQAQARHLPGDIDLLSVDYFGRRVTLATFQLLGRLSCVVVPSSMPHLGSPSSSQRSPLSALGARRCVN